MMMIGALVPYESNLYPHNPTEGNAVRWFTCSCVSTQEDEIPVSPSHFVLRKSLKSLPLTELPVFNWSMIKTTIATTTIQSKRLSENKNKFKGIYYPNQRS